MLHQAPVAEYPFSQANLWKRCLELFPSLDRDVLRLKSFGVTEVRIAKFKEDTRLFGEMDPDTVVVQEGAVATQEKNVEQEHLITSIQKVLGRVGLKDDPRTAAYKRFGAKNVANDSEADLHLAGAMVVKQGRKYLAEYAGVGLTAEMLNEVETNNGLFVEGLTSRQDSDNEQQAATDVRIGAANALYRELVKLCGAGHTSWEFDDKTRADEYVVDAAAGAAAPAAGPTA